MLTATCEYLVRTWRQRGCQEDLTSVAGDRSYPVNRACVCGMGVRTGTGWYLQQCPVGGASEVCRAGTPDLFLRVLSGGGQYCTGGIFQCDRTGTCIFPDRGIAWNHCDQPDGIHAVEAFWCNWCLDGISGYRGRDIWYCDGNSGCE